MKRFAIWNQDFEKIINNGSFYLDKTKKVFELISSSSEYYFFSRPRRFGKSLLLSVMKNIFLGKKELFKWLYIYDKRKFEKYPVMYLDFGWYSEEEDIEEYIKENWKVYIGDKIIRIGEFEKFNLWSILENIMEKT